MVSAPKMIELSYRLTPKTEAWELPEIPVPESHAHNLLVTYLFEVLSAWVEREKREALVVRNLALRWMEAHPRVGLDPDVALIEPVPPDSKQLKSLCTWKAGHVAPRLAIEVVSENHPYKDYLEIQERYADCGVQELWVIDPELHGPKRFGGPQLLQVWRLYEDGSFGRTYSGDRWHSPALDAWVRVRAEADGRTPAVVLSEEPEGERPWRTNAEAERAGRLAEREARRAERAGRLAAEARVRELEADLQRRH